MPYLMWVGNIVVVCSCQNKDFYDLGMIGYRNPPKSYNLIIQEILILTEERGDER